jgi:SP family galactose:H+ symporter-like MFS transporter
LLLQNPTQRIALIVIAFGLLFGFGITSIAGVLDQLTTLFNLDTSGQETLVSVLVAACFFGALLAGPLSARLGRHPAMILAATLALLGYVVIALQPSFHLLIGARVVIGLSIGLSSMVVPLYAAESTAATHRGAVVSLFQLAITAGILCAYTSALLLGSRWNGFDLMALGLVPALLAAGTLFTLPESPRWLQTHKTEAEAAGTALRLGLQDEWVSIEVQDAQPVATDAMPKKLPAPRIVAVLALCSGLFVLQNFSGIDGILYYAPHIFQTLGFAPGLAALAATFGLGVVNFLATIVAMRIVDGAGRRPLMIWGSAFMVAGLALVLVAMHWNWPWVSLFGLSLFILAFAVSLGPLPYVMMSELFPRHIRERGIAAAASTSWLFNALIAYTFLSATQAFGLQIIIAFFALVCLASLVISLRYLPETRGARLEDIETDVMQGCRLRELGKRP